MALELPEELKNRYRDDRHVARMPFLLNDLVDDAEAYGHIKHMPVGEKDIFVGIAGLRALDILANTGENAGRQHQRAVLFDSNHTQIKAMQWILTFIKEAETPQEFVKKFIPHYVNWVDHVPRSRDPKNPTKPHPKQTVEDTQYFGVRGAGSVERDPAVLQHYFEDQLKNPNSWLSPTHYKHIRELAQHDDIATAVIELSDPQRMKTLKSWMEENQYQASDVYLSSALFMLHPARHFNYYSKPASQGVNPYNPLMTLLTPTTRTLISEHYDPSTRPLDVHHIFKLALRDRNAVRDMQTRYNALAPHFSPAEKDYGFIFGVGETTLALTTETVNGKPYFYIFFESMTPDNKVMEALNRGVAKLGLQVHPEIDPPVARRMGASRSHVFSIPEGMLGQMPLFEGIRDTIGRELLPALQKGVERQ